MSQRKRVAKKSLNRPATSVWIVLRISLVARGGAPVSRPPGRDLLAHSTKTFADLAAAIDRAFARWDLAHLHEFRLPDGRVIGMTDADEFEQDENILDDRGMTIGAAGLHLGDSFQYLFDLGDGWEHRCTVLRDDVDPLEEWRRRPNEIVPIHGWGAIPDQYGRSRPDPVD